MSVVLVSRPRLALKWQSFEAWVGTRGSGAALFGLALVVFAIQSIVLPVHPGRDMGRYVQTYLQLFYEEPVLPSVMNTRGPLAALGVALPLELGGAAAEIWLALLYAASIVAWGYVALTFGPRTAVLTSGLLLLYPGYGILFHGLASDALFAAAFAGWAVLLSRAILRPSVGMFLATGAGMGLLVLVRPSNQVLIAMTLVPQFVRAPWSRRLAWTAAFFVGSAAVTQGWKALADLRYSEGVALTPSKAVLITTLLLLPLLLPAAWRRRVVLFAIPVVAVAVAVVAIRGPSIGSPSEYARNLAQAPSSQVFLFRAFEINRIVAPDNGPASAELARAVERELLTKEPYLSYGIDVDEFFASGSDRVFGDLTSLGGSTDLPAVTHEAIREHPGVFARGIDRTIWQQLWSRRIYAETTGSSDDDGGSTGAGEETAFIVVNGRKLPRPSEGQPIPASHVGPEIWTLWGGAREVWRSATEHSFVFDDPRDERRYANFERETARLAGRIPTREGNPGLVHRLNQASHAFPPLAFWLAVGVIALAVRHPQHALVAVASSVAALILIVGTSLVALAVAAYAAPVSPALLLLATAGLAGANPRRRLTRRGVRP